MKNENTAKNKKGKTRGTGTPPSDVKPVAEGKNSVEDKSIKQAESDLNAKILELTMTINDDYPELSKYLDEMPVTVPSESDPEISINQLKSYYESLNSLVNKYKDDNPEHR